MTEELEKLESHTLLLDNRKKLRLTGVTDVDSFDESTITAYTVLGELTIAGSGLRVLSLNTEQGELLVEGTVASLLYLDQPPRKDKLLSRLFR